MFAFTIQTILLIAIFYILGCLVGTILRRLFSSNEVVEEPVKAAPVEKKQAAAPPPVKPAAKPEPIKAVEKPAPKPAPAPAPKADPDDLKRIRGIGPQNEQRLNAIGVMTFAQIAAWNAKEQQEIGERLAFPGRIEREEWVKQAGQLASGEQTAFSKRVDAGEVASSKGTAKATTSGKKPSGLNAAPADGGDKLDAISGVGSALAKKLNALGIYHYSQIANWSAAEQEWIGNELGFPGRPQRENWAGEAKALASGNASSSPKSGRGDIKPK